MKKAMKKVSVFAVVILTLLMSLFCFTSCGEKGVYRLKSYKVGNTTTELEWTEPAEGEEEEYSYVELKKGDAATINVSELGCFTFVEAEGTWERDGDNIVITQTAQSGNTTITNTYKFTIDGDTLVWAYSDNVTLTFEKI